MARQILLASPGRSGAPPRDSNAGTPSLALRRTLRWGKVQEEAAAGRSSEEGLRLGATERQPRTEDKPKERGNGKANEWTTEMGMRHTGGVRGGQRRLRLGQEEVVGAVAYLRHRPSCRL